MTKTKLNVYCAFFIACCSAIYAMDPGPIIQQGSSRNLGSTLAIARQYLSSQVGYDQISIPEQDVLVRDLSNGQQLKLVKKTLGEQIIFYITNNTKPEYVAWYLAGKGNRHITIKLDGPFAPRLLIPSSNNGADKQAVIIQDKIREQLPEYYCCKNKQHDLVCLFSGGRWQDYRFFIGYNGSGASVQWPEKLDFSLISLLDTFYLNMAYVLALKNGDNHIFEALCANVDVEKQIAFMKKNRIHLLSAMDLSQTTANRCN